MPRRKNSDSFSAPHPGAINLNQVVAANLRLLRERRGMTQQQVANALSEVTDRKHTKSMISAMENGVHSTKRRVFDAHELLGFARAFDIPITWFLTPPPEMANERLDIGGLEHGYNTPEFLFGSEAGELHLRERLEELSEAGQLNLIRSAERRALVQEIGLQREARTDAVIESRAAEIGPKITALVSELTDFANELSQKNDGTQDRHGVSDQPVAKT